MKERLTSRRQEILAFVLSYLTRNRVPPTLREIGDAVGLRAVSSVHGHLSALHRMGLLVTHHSRHRGLILTPSGLDALGQQRDCCPTCQRPFWRSA